MPAPAITSGLNVGKRRLDAAIEPADLERALANDRSGRRELREWLRRH